MAIQVKELGGRSGDTDSESNSHVLIYDAWDDTTRWADTLALRTAVLAAAPTTFDGVARISVSWDEGEEDGHTVFEVTYSSAEPAESLLNWSFDTTGGTVRARTSRATTSYPISGRTAPDFKHAVEVAGGTPQGVDIVIPALKLTATYKWPQGVISLANAKNIADVTGRVNDASFYGFAAGELLFLGATGTIDPTIPTEIQYNFAASANATLNIGTWISSIVKGGHQHLWVAFEEVEDTASDKVIPRPLAAYVETMYLDTDFSAFGIGTS